MKIIDCITFFNELKLLEFRLTETCDYVDYFVIVESTKTFTGNDKPLYYQNHKHLFEKWKHKILHVIFDDIDVPNIKDSDISINPLYDEYWTRERHQRNAAMKALLKLDLNPNDIILVSDSDEIMNQRVLKDLQKYGVNGLYIVCVDAYLYSLRYKIEAGVGQRVCAGSRAVDWESLQKIGTLDKVRNTFNYNKEYYPNGTKNDGKYGWLLLNAGWHLSYFGSREEIVDKIQSFSHQEFNKSEVIENIDEYISSGRYVHTGFPTSIIELSDNKNLPINYHLLLD